MRPEEYLALRWSDVDFESFTITVNRAVVFLQKGFQFAPTKTVKSRRSIPVSKSLVDKLTVRRESQKPNKLDLIFASSNETPLKLSNLRNRDFKRICVAAKLSKPIRVYDLRHSCATLLLSAGVNPKIVAERLGHSSIVLTLDTYSHVSIGMQSAATEKLDDILRR